MADFTVPNEHQSKIIARNGIDPKSVAVVMEGIDFLVLLCYKTRDIIRLQRGDRAW